MKLVRNPNMKTKINAKTQRSNIHVNLAHEIGFLTHSDAITSDFLSMSKIRKKALRKTPISKPKNIKPSIAMER